MDTRRISKPLVGIPCDRRNSGGQFIHLVAEEYLSAVRDGAGALPIPIAALEPPLSTDEMLAIFDGFLFTGSPSNVAPHLYGGASPRPGTWLDEARDATTIPLLRAAVAAGVPSLCICRGFQELNVAFGGTLHQHIQEIAGNLDHRPKKDVSIDEEYAPAHEIRIEAGGMLAGFLQETRVCVNSLHSQGIERLAANFSVEARAEDGVIEAISMKGAKNFLLGVQWHPEWRQAENAISRRIFAAFGQAVSDHAKLR